jgi:hypothetical protein
MRSNRGESLDMTEHYADVEQEPSSLDKVEYLPGTRFEQPH